MAGDAKPEPARKAGGSDHISGSEPFVTSGRPQCGHAEVVRAGGPEGEPAVVSIAGRGCAPPLGLLRLPSILPAVRHRPPVVHWRGFLAGGSHRANERVCGLGAQHEGRRSGAVSARTGVAGLNGPPVFRRHGLNRRAVADRPAASARTRRRARTRGCCPVRAAPTPQAGSVLSGRRSGGPRMRSPPPGRVSVRTSSPMPALQPPGNDKRLPGSGAPGPRGAASRKQPGVQGPPVESASVAVTLAEPGARVGAVAPVPAAGRASGASIAAGTCEGRLFGSAARGGTAKDSDSDPAAAYTDPDHARR